MDTLALTDRDDIAAAVEEQGPGVLCGAGVECPGGTR